MLKKNMLLLILIIFLMIVPLIFNGDAEYGGADGEADSTEPIL